MGELVPSVLLHGQALQLLKDLEQAQKDRAFRTVSDGVEALANIITTFERDAATPLMNYNPVVETEPPSSSKTNRFLEMANRDVNVLQQQMDILNASTRFTHNMVVTEVMRSKNDNARVRNKLKTLQMYSGSIDPTTITFGDSFKSLEFTDVSMTPAEERAALFQEGYVTLAPEGEITDVSKEARVTVLDTSNGFVGNNHQVESSAVVEGQTNITLKSEVRVYNNITAINDSSPSTWVEYEKYDIAQTHIEQAGGFGVGNFSYSRVKADGNTENIVWVGPPTNGVLELGIQLELPSVRDINSIEFLPYGLDNNANNPVLVKRVQTSPDGTNWTPIDPAEVWVGTDINLNVARAAKNVTTGVAAWSFETRPVRYVRIYFEQPNPIDVNVGHIYWVTPRGTSLGNNGTQSEQVLDNEKREKGPIPPISDPAAHNDSLVLEEKLQRREIFPAKRWAVGIRDITMRQANYQQRSTLVTQKLQVGGIVDRVVLSDAQFSVPPSYPTDQEWVRFWISPDDGRNWYPIARIQDDYLGIPEQIAFNDPLPQDFRESGVAYYATEEPVTSLRLKIELSRPADVGTTTPVLRSYTLKVRRQG